MPDTPLFPVKTFTTAAVPAMNIVIIRPDYPQAGDLPTGPAHKGRTYALTPPQVLWLVETLLRELEELKMPPTYVEQWRASQPGRLEDESLPQLPAF